MSELYSARSTRDKQAFWIYARGSSLQFWELFMGRDVLEQHTAQALSFTYLYQLYCTRNEKKLTLPT